MIAEDIEAQDLDIETAEDEATEFIERVKRTIPAVAQR